LGGIELEGVQGGAPIVGKEQEFFAVSGEGEKRARLARLRWCGKKRKPRGGHLKQWESGKVGRLEGHNGECADASEGGRLCSGGCRGV